MFDGGFLCAASAGVTIARAMSDSDLFGQAIVVIQILMSGASWGVMFQRTMLLKALGRADQFFVNEFVRQPDVLSLYVRRDAQIEDSPMARIYTKTCERLVGLIPASIRTRLTTDPTAPIKLKASRINLVDSTCEHVLSEQVIEINRQMGWLAIITSSAPLLGLLGTVWGVMLAFQAMAEKGTALISELAPGVSSALLTTVVGLVVAIPSTIFYNCLSKKIETMTVDLEGFSDELMGRIELNFQEGGE